MSRIPEIQLQEILQKSDIASVIGEYVSLKPATQGALLGLCPFHSEKSPSFRVNREKGYFKCFGCGEGGNLFTFLMKAENLGFHEAALELARRAGVTLQLTEIERQELNEKERLYDVMERAALYYQDVLRSPDGQAAREYLRRRGIGEELWASFRLGFAPGSSRLLRFLTDKGFTPEEASRVGLLGKNEGDFFYHRVTFPITDPHGRVIAMGGRTMDNSEPKYLNSKETVLYSKSRNLYALYQSRGSVAKQDHAIVVEGYMDAIALHQAGFTNAIATLGTSLTREQAELLRRYCQKATIAYDADNAGRTAAERGIGIFEEAGLKVRILVLPDGEDPDSLARKAGPNGFRTVLNEAPGVVDFLAGTLARKLDVKTPEGKTEFFQQLGPILARLQDPVLISEYVRRYAHRLGVSEQDARHAIRQVVAGKAPLLSRSLLPTLAVDEELVSYLLSRPEGIDRARDRVAAEDLLHAECREIFRRLLEASSLADGLSPASLLTLFPEEGKASKVSELLLDPRRPPLTTEYLEGLILRIEKRRKQLRLKQIQAEIHQKIDNGPLDPGDPLLFEQRELSRHLQGTR